MWGGGVEFSNRCDVSYRETGVKFYGFEGSQAVVA